MSTENFAAVSFPALRHVNQDAMDAQVRAHGHATGYASGLRAAEAETARRIAELELESAESLRQEHARIDAAVEALDAAALALHTRIIPTVEDAQNVLAASALDLAEAIIGYELQDGQNSARAALARALSHVGPQPILSIRMNPADAFQLDNANRTTSMIDIIPDESIGRGDAVANFSDGSLDARIQTAVDRARSALLGEAS
ncbi:MAG: FliH/SctL family protein [Lacisediminihabitans sp.]